MQGFQIRALLTHGGAQLRKDSSSDITRGRFRRSADFISVDAGRVSFLLACFTLGDRRADVADGESHAYG